MSYAYGGGNYAAGDYAYGGGNYQAGGIIKDIGKGLLGLVKKTPIGFVASTALSLIKPKPPMIDVVYRGEDALMRNPGGVLVGGGAAGVAIRPELMGMCNVKGRRLNKSTYVTRGGGTSGWPQQILIHPKGTECVKSRRMNVTNVRALRRAVRRATGFAKLARRVMTFVNAKAPKGRAKFKRK